MAIVMNVELPVDGLGLGRKSASSGIIKFVFVSTS